MEAWKQKLAAERNSKQKEQGSGGTRSLLDEMDKKAEIASTASLAEPSAAEPPERAPSNEVEELPEPTHYAGKFDPKAIVKKAHTASTTASKLGLDIALPEQPNVSVAPTSETNGVKAGKPTATQSQAQGKSPILLQEVLL